MKEGAERVAEPRDRLPLRLAEPVAADLLGPADLLADVIAGAIAAVFGGSNLQVSGPTGAMTVEQVPLHSDLPPADHHEEEQALLGEHIVAYRLDGPLLFAAAHRFLLELTEAAQVKVVILRMSRVSALDASGVRVLGDAIDKLTRRGALVLVSGIREAHRPRLDALSILDQLHAEGRIFATTPEAIAFARAHLHGAGLLTGQNGDMTAKAVGSFQ